MNPFLESAVAKPVCPTINKKSFWHNQHKRRTIRFIGSAAIVVSTLMPAMVNAVDLNQANLQELLNLKGIGPKTAQMIIDERNRGGQFESIEDLSDRVKGIGPKKAENLINSGLIITSPKDSSDHPELNKD